MTFPFDVYLLALMAAALCCAASLPVWRKACLRLGLVDDPGHRKIHQQIMPLAGGLAVFTGVALPLVAGAVYMLLEHPGAQSAELLRHGFSRRGIQLSGIVFGAFGMLLLGMADDKWELSAATKFTGQLLIALIVAAAGVRITLFVPSLAFSYAITVLWILAIINAFNFMDNMNGLCAGVGAIATIWFGMLAAIKGQYLVTLFACLTAGALCGFLPFNFPKASAFLGDAGSHLTGYLLGVLAILPHFHTSTDPQIWPVFSPLLVLAVPLADLAWVVVLRTARGKPFYIGDTNHFSHQLVRRGMSQRRAVLVIWLVSALTGALALL